MGDPVSIALYTISAGMKISAQMEQERATEAAINLREKQEELKAADEASKQITQVRDVLSKQRASAAAAGIAPSSMSFFAIQEDTFNKFAEDQRTRDLNKLIMTDELEAKRHEAKQKEFFGIGSAIFEGAQGAYGGFSQQSQLDKLLGRM